MKKDVIVTKLSSKLSPDKERVILEILKGKPYSEQGGTWVEVEVDILESVTEALDFDPRESGFAKYLDMWYHEGLITEQERDTGSTYPKEKTL